MALEPGGGGTRRRWLGVSHPHPQAPLVNGRTGRFRANVVHTNSQAFTGSYPQRWTTSRGALHRCGQGLGKSMWTDTKRHIAVHVLWTGVDCLLKKLGTTSRLRSDVVHRPGDKPGGYPVDSRWTAVDNRVRGDDCGHRPLFIPGFPTCESPVDNLLTCANSGSPQSAQDL